MASYFSFSGKLISWDNSFQRRKFRKRYAFYYGKSAIGTFPVTGFDGQKERLQQTFEKMAGPKHYAETSGTTSDPKLVPFDAKRTKLLRKTFLRSMITLTRDIPGQKTFFVFASLKKDQSLTSGMMDQEKEPGYFELLQAPYRYLQTKEGEALIERVGELTARIMVLAITQPRFLYATNPSTLTYFLKELEGRWKEVRVRLKNIPPGLMRLSDKNGERMLMTFLIREKAPKLQELLPDLRGIITWDGGYVGPFLEQLKATLPGVAFLPMYSMSTETVETLPHRVGDKLCFFPIVKGMYPEFADEAGKILPPFELEKDKCYELIVSDEWGLRRYATGDIFLVRDLVNLIPDLVFVKRKGMTSSVTGEKLTEEHVREMRQTLSRLYPEVSGTPYTVYPVSQKGEIGYEIGVISRTVMPDGFAEAADAELSRINHEYKSKVKSGRLKPISLRHITEQELACQLGRESQWESQFKVLPLYEKLIVR